MTFSGIDIGPTRESAASLRSNRAFVAEAQTSAVRVVSGVGRNQYLGSVASAVETLLSTIDSLETLLDQKAEAMEYAAIHEYGLAGVLEGHAAETAAQLRAQVDAAYSDPVIVAFSGPPVPDTADAAIEQLDAAPDAAAAAAIFAKLPQGMQIDVASERPDLVAKAAPELDYIPKLVLQEFERASKYQLGSVTTGVKGSVEASAFKYYVALGGNIYAQIAVNSDGTAELTLALIVNTEVGKEIDFEKEFGKGAASLDIEAMARVGAISSDQGYVTIKFPNEAQAKEKLDGLIASFEDDVEIEGWDDLPVNTLNYFNEMLDDTVVWTYVHSQGIRGSAEVSAEVELELSEVEAEMAASMSAAAQQEVMVSISDDNSASLSVQISAEAARSLSAELEIGDVVDFDGGVGANVEGSAKVTLGTDADGQVYMEVELSGQYGVSGNANGAEGAVSKSYTATARVDLDSDAWENVKDVINGDASLLDGADVTLQEATIVDSSGTLAEGEGDYWIGGWEGSAEIYVSTTVTDRIRLKPPDGEFYDPDATLEQLKSLPNSPP